MAKSSDRYVAYVGRPLRTGIKTCPERGVMRRATKKGLIGRQAHPVVCPPGRKRKPLSRSAWHIEYLLRCAKRGENVIECNLAPK